MGFPGWGVLLELLSQKIHLDSLVENIIDSLNDLSGFCEFLSQNKHTLGEW